MIEKQTAVGKIVKWSLLIILSIFALLPLYAVIIVALTPSSHVMNMQLFPKFFEISNFVTGFISVGRGIGNSFLYSIIATFMALIISVPAAYVLGRYNFKGKRVILFSLLFTQMISGIVLLPSLYMFFQKLNISNSIPGLIVVMCGVNLALVVWIFYGYFQTLPVGIEEAAMIDGCNYVGMLLRIIIPLSGPSIAVGAIFVFINTYNEFVIPLFLLTDRTQYTLTLTLYSMLTDTTIRWEVVAASSLIGIIPPVFIFIFFQKYIISGLTTGAVKS